MNNLNNNAKQEKKTQKIQASQQLQKKYGVHSKLNLGSQNRNENKLNKTQKNISKATRHGSLHNFDFNAKCCR